MKKCCILLLVATLATTLKADSPWPMFRGPEGNGFTTSRNLPLSWSETNNVQWKTEIPQRGWSTPVLAAGRIWLTSATPEGTEFYLFAVDAQSGKIVISNNLFSCAAPEPLGNNVNCYAAPSPATDGKRVYVSFGSYGTAAINASNGKLLWQRTDLPCRHFRGPGSSVFLHSKNIILTFDGVDQQYLTALDTATGKTVWRTDRDIEWKDLDANGVPYNEGDFRKGFTTPIVIKFNGSEQLISPASNAIFSYDPATGKELWRVSNTQHTPVVCPLFDGEKVYAVTGHGGAAMLAISPDGSGDVSKTHVHWRISGKDVPDTPSPVVLNGYLYMLSDHGALSCINTTTGEIAWRQMLGGAYIASPIHDGERIFFFGASGKSTVIKAGPTFEKLAESRMRGGFMASPLVDGNSLILRTKTHLYRISQTPAN